MKCLDNLIQYNIDYVKAITGFQKSQVVMGVSKTPSSSEGFKKSQTVARVSKTPGSSGGFKNPR